MQVWGCITVAACPMRLCWPGPVPFLWTVTHYLCDFSHWSSARPKNSQNK